ncbi:unnamed protein product [Symbiodinium pilosum]|uniref:Uncharacterized protein n=1 Tax=Symbiodinium pilosum TaxID=2952 RepID=A0A812SHW7_SYMPI|nr:unnamed protein product [Symbiodinium pilosum]
MHWLANALRFEQLRYQLVAWRLNRRQGCHSHAARVDRLQAERKIPSAFGRHLVGQLGLYWHTQLPAYLGAGVRLHTCPGFMPRLLHAGGKAGHWVLHGFDTELWEPVRH